MKSFIFFCTILISITALSLGKQESGKNQEDIYQKIPENQRELLRQAVQKLIEAEKKSDWKSVFELVEKRPGQTEDTFVKEMERRKLLREFLPISLTFIPPEDGWIFEGCASFEGDTKDMGRYSTIHAHWKGFRWYLSGVATEMFEKGKTGKCSMLRSVGQSD